MTRLIRMLASFGVGVVIVASVAYGLALVENYSLWGFWFSRPTLAVELDETIALQGLSAFEVLPNGLPDPSPATRAKLVELAPKMCRVDQPDRDFYCLADRLLLRLTERVGPLERVPEVATAALSGLWTQYRKEGWQAQVEPGYPGTPHLGVMIQFGKRSETYAIVAYETLQIAGDRYAYAEALYRLGSEPPVLLREHRQFFEVAGAEGFRTPALTVLNALFLIPGIILIGVARRKPTLGAMTAVMLGSFVLLGGAVWLLGHAVWASGGWEWQPVGVIWACLLGSPALLAIAIGALRLRERA